MMHEGKIIYDVSGEEKKNRIFNLGTIHEKKALNGVNLHLDDGDFVTIIGGNGAESIFSKQRNGDTQE